MVKALLDCKRKFKKLKKIPYFYILQTTVIIYGCS